MKRSSLAFASALVLLVFLACADSLQNKVGKDTSAQEPSPEAVSRQLSAEAKRLLRRGDDAKAIVHARDALRQHESNVEAMLVIAEVFCKQGKHELAISVTDSILEIDALSDEEKSQAYNSRAFAYLQAGDRKKAFDSARLAAELDDENATAWNNLGVLYMWKGQPEVAETCFDYVTEIDPEFVEAQLNLGVALRANGKLTEAESAFHRVVELRPDWADVHFNLGVLYLDAQKIENLDTIAKLQTAMREFETYKSLASKDTTSVEPSAQLMGNELVSVARADLYIKTANERIESEKPVTAPPSTN